ncbi:hypothetical protein ACH4OW_28275 [Streptomyces sp. NPDC017056]|uniref:hypothetical protein n=1 Tax=Streptomyces sp. NPDC017056 TaxID=3364973 RepID=UPI0037B6885F
MSFRAGDKVEIVSCSDDPRAVGLTGRIEDEVPPGLLTEGRWTVGGIDVFVGPVLCRTAELRKVN